MTGSDRRRLFAALRRAGFSVEQSRSSHYAVRDRHGRRVATIPHSASDRRAWRNTIADLRRLGLAWPPDRPKGRPT